MEYRKNFSQRELMVIWPDFPRVYHRQNTTATAYAAKRALGLRVTSTRPSVSGNVKPLPNVGVQALPASAPSAFWDLQASGTDADPLNECVGGATLVRKDGFRLLGNSHLLDDPLFLFENYTRTAQVLADTMAEAHMWAVDKPITATLIRDIVDGINAKFREPKSNGYIVEGKCWFDENRTTRKTLKAGNRISTTTIHQSSFL